MSLQSLPKEQSVLGSKVCVSLRTGNVAHIAEMNNNVLPAFPA